MKNLMSYSGNPNFFLADTGQSVHVFEWWTVQGDLRHDAVPFGDDYNFKRLQDIASYPITSWKYVGQGTIEHIAGRIPSRFNHLHVVVDWQRTAESPPFIYRDFHWKRLKRLVIFRLRILKWKLARTPYHLIRIDIE